MKKNRLKKMRLDEISLVPSGDDPGADVLIAKAAPKAAKKLGRKLTPAELKQRLDAAESPVPAPAGHQPLHAYRRAGARLAVGR